MKEKLKQCKDCGGNPSMESNRFGIHVKCLGCGSRTYSFITTDDFQTDHEKAVKAWNKGEFLTEH